MKTQLLVNTPFGTQEILHIGEGGGYFDLALVIWDERNDGPMPEPIVLGSMARIDGGVLINDAVDGDGVLIDDAVTAPTLVDDKASVPLPAWSVAERKAHLIDLVRSVAKARRDGGITVNGLLIATGPAGRSLLFGAIQGGKASRKIVTKTGRAVLTKVQIEALAAAVDNYLQAVFDNQYDLEEAIEGAAEQSKLDAIDINAGWPA